MRKIMIGTSGLVLISIVVIAAHMLVLGAVADAENGRSPFTAVALQDGKNTGILAPGQARWYRLVQKGEDGAFQRQMDLTLFFTPDDGNRIHHVNFQIFPADQITHWYWGDASEMQNLGAGGIVSRDGNPLTGERLWSGWVIDRDTYYIQVFNGADATVDYWLFTDDIIGVQLGEDAAPPAAVDVPAGADPNYPMALEPGLQRGHLTRGQETWYSLVYNDYDAEAYEAHSLTLIFTPDDGNRVHQVGFEIIPFDQLHVWERGDTDQLRNVGAGSVVSRDGDPLTGERLWSGWLMDGDTYLLKIYNQADVDVDFWLFQDDVLRAELGQPSPPSPQADVPAGADPNHPLPLEVGLNMGVLDPGQKHWFSFVRNDFDQEVFEELTLSLFFTPNDGNRIHYVNFDIFPADQLHIWQRGDTDQLRNLGAGSVIARDGDPNTGELLWDGWLMDGQTYYVRLQNGSDVVIDYWFFTDDVIHPQLGEALAQ